MENVDEELMDEPGFEVKVIGGSKGKGLFAVKHFKKGDIIFEERPLVCCQFSWNEAYGYLACDYCLRPLEGAEENIRRLTGKVNLVLPYPQCCPTNTSIHSQCPFCGVRYCSEECQKQAWNQYHQILCFHTHERNGSHPLEQLNEAWKQIHFPPETCTIMLLARMIANVRQAEDREGAMHLFMQFCHQTVNEEQDIVHKLLGEKYVQQMEVLRQLMINALYDDSVQHWLTKEGFQKLFVLVGTNGQGVGTSPLSEWVKTATAQPLPADEMERLDAFIDKLYEDLADEAGGFLNNEGSALYALQSSCNHSCDPNAVATFPYSNFQVVMCATRDIFPGEEICISYLEDCVLERSRHTRHKILRDMYLFVCECTKCESQAQDLDVTSDEEEDEDDEEEQ